MGEILIGLTGVILFMGCVWVFSSNHRRLNWRIILWGLVLQLVFVATLACLMTGAIAGLCFSRAATILTF